MKKQLAVFLSVMMTLGGFNPRPAAAINPAPGQTLNYTTEPIVPGVPLNPYHGEVSISGATLFLDFFTFPASTNDFADVDGDGCSGFTLSGPCPATDTLARPWAGVSPATTNTFWAFTYRSVGSVNGLNEFIDYQLLGTLSTSIPGERGLFQQQTWANLGSTTWGGPFCNASGAPFCPDAGIGITAACLDVPFAWATVPVGSNPLDAFWGRKPGTSGFGQNATVTNTGWVHAYQSIERPGAPVQFNANYTAPDANTIYDTTTSWVPVATVVNRGVGKSDFRYTELQHLFTTGRLPNGENLVAVTRSTGSGTHSAYMNSIGVDPSWGRGENVGPENLLDVNTRLGAFGQAGNQQGSGLVENSTRYRRLGVGYTGLGGPSRAAEDRRNGNYEIGNVCKDIDGDGDSVIDSDCTPQVAYTDDGAGDVSAANNGFVRATIDTVLDNDDPKTGYQIGGPQSWVTRGDPLAVNFDFNQDGDSTDPHEAADTTHVGSFPMSYLPTAAYLKNINESIKNFIGAPANVENIGMPGELLSTKFTLIASVDALPQLAPTNNPTKFVDQTAPAFNQSLQDYLRANNDLALANVVTAFGAVNTAGFTPRRAGIADAGGIPYLYADASTGTYSDGSTNGNYYYFDNTNTLRNVGQSALLNQRNRIAGDFNNDTRRDISDAGKMVQAMFNPRSFEKGVNHPGDANRNGGLVGNYAIAEVLGDFDGDGNFDKEDLRYFMDGLGMYPNHTGSLNRKQAAIAIDAAIVASAPTTDYTGAAVPVAKSWLPWASTNQHMVVPPAAAGGNPGWALPPSVDAGFLATGKPYKNGDFRGDIAGTTVLNGAGNRYAWRPAAPTYAAPTPGAAPTGWDGKVDVKDIDYVVANILKVTGPAVWSDLNNAVAIDLSCDMDGDLDVDCDDVKEIVEVILETQFGDANLDGVVNAADEPTGYPKVGGWADGDFNCDGMVTQADHDIWASKVCVPIGVLSWKSVRSHSGIGELAIDLNPTATGNGLSGPTVESRGSAAAGVGIAKILVELNTSATLADASKVSASGRLTDPAGVMGPAAPYSPTSVMLVSPTTLAIMFTPPLPDQGCYRIELLAGLFTCPLAGDLDVNVRGLWADVTGDGQVVLGDSLAVKARVSQPVVPTNVRYDTNMAGGAAINLGDALAVKARVNSPVRQARCP